MLHYQISSPASFITAAGTDLEFNSTLFAFNYIILLFLLFAFLSVFINVIDRCVPNVPVNLEKELLPEWVGNAW